MRRVAKTKAKYPDSFVPAEAVEDATVSLGTIIQQDQLVRRLVRQEDEVVWP